MIKTLEVRNFKSLKNLQLDCKRVNIFIGKPNTGKSNILESVGIFSFPFGELKDFIRFESMTNLFYDQNLVEKIQIIPSDHYCEIMFANGTFIGQGYQVRGFEFKFKFNYDGTGGSTKSKFSPIKFYKFGVINNFSRPESDVLLPPKGENLVAILQVNKVLRKASADIFSEYGLRIVLKPQEGKIETQKEVEDIIISYPYSLVSDTLQRVVFHLAAIETNKNSVIIFEEPEAHAFPYYTKFLAERIALNETNQYFISTHNPYFLMSVLEKIPKEDIGIFITYYQDYQTKLKPIFENELSQIMDLDASIFFNLDRFLQQ